MVTAMAAAAVLVAALLATSSSAVPLQQHGPEQDRCGYESCPVSDPTVLNVHIVPHTHDDVGWLKTVDQYYYGSKNSIQKAGVQYILDSVVRELWEDPKRRFIYVETAFFWKWWRRQRDDIRHKVHALVRQGRLEFIGGAWSMNDEADVHYQSTVDQFTWGLRKLNETFGECGRPRVGWQIDPFGHSREMASLLAAMGYDGLFHGRIDYQDKEARMANRSMEMLWRGNDDLGAASDLFTGILYNTYSPPPGFCFDVLCQDEPIIDDATSPMFNVDSRVRTFLGFVVNQTRAYRTGNVLLTMGGDFTYMDAGMWYTNLDLLIRYTNMQAAKDNLNVKLFYSTPSCYLKAVHDANPTLPTKQDDFFPYASDANSYWTGYFTSRPTIKYFERRGNSYLQMAKQLQVLGHLEEHNHFIIDELRSAMGIMQHHDAVTGTEKQHVADDYARILDVAIEDSLVVARQAISKIMEGDPFKTSELELVRCQLNISQCAASENNDQFIVTLYNPLAWAVTTAVRVPITHAHYSVHNPKGDLVESQTVMVPPELAAVPARRSRASRELVFLAEAPPLGYRSYYVQRTAGATRAKRQTKGAPALELPAEYYGDAPLSLQDRQDRMAIEQIAKYIMSQSTPDRHDVYTQESTASPAVMEPEPGASDRRADSEEMGEPSAATAETTFSARLEEFARSLLGDAGREPAAAPDARYNFVRMSAMDDERMLGDEPQLVRAYSDDDFIENEAMRLNLDRTTGEFTNLVLRDGTDITFDIDLLYYPGRSGDNSMPVKRASGAYIFRPNGTRATPLPNRNTTIVKGPLVQEVRHAYGDYASSVTRLYRGSDVLEFEWLVGPIPVLDGIGKEVVVRYHTNLSNGGFFYTDSNGRQTLERRLNSRPQWHLKLSEPIAGNYYPVTSKILIAGQGVRLAVLNDRAQGGSSLEEGQIELMVHRRLLHDDAFGVGEALNETEYGAGLVARGTHYIAVGRVGSATSKFEKKKALEVLLAPEVLISNGSTMSFDNWVWLKNEWSGIKAALPEGVHLLTLEPWKGETVLVRLEHTLERADLAGRNGSVSVDLAELFTNLKPLAMKETSLAANQWAKDRKPLVWQRENEFARSFNEMYGGRSEPALEVTGRGEVDGFLVTLQPMEIRTFVVEYEKVV